MCGTIGRNKILWFAILFVFLFLLCTAPMLSDLYAYNRTHVSVRQEGRALISIKDTPLTQTVYLEGRASNLGVRFFSPSGPLYGESTVTITVTQGDTILTDTVLSRSLRTESDYNVDPVALLEEDHRYELTYRFDGSLARLQPGEAVITASSQNLPEGTDLFCIISNAPESGLPEAQLNGVPCGGTMVLEYDVLKTDSPHFYYETLLLAVLGLLMLLSAYLLTYRPEWLRKTELLYVLAFLLIFTVIAIRNPYASLWGEPRSEATYEFWYKANKLGLRNSIMILMSGEALAWFERIFIWVVNKIVSVKYVFQAAQTLELCWICFVTALPCLRCFRRFFRDEIRFAASLLLGTALFFDSAYYFWACSYWSIIFLLLFALMPLDRMPAVLYGGGLVLAAILCVSRIYHILFIPSALLVLLLFRGKEHRRLRIYALVVTLFSAFEGAYSLTAGHSLTAGSGMLENLLNIGFPRMIVNTLYYQLQVILSFLFGGFAAHTQGSGTNILAGLLFCGGDRTFPVSALQKTVEDCALDRHAWLLEPCHDCGQRLHRRRL